MSNWGDFQSLFQLGVAINIIATTLDDFRKPVAIAYQRRIKRMREDYLNLQERLHVHLSDKSIDERPFKEFDEDLFNSAKLIRDVRRKFREHESNIIQGRALFTALTAFAGTMLLASSAYYSSEISCFWGLVSGVICLIPVPAMLWWSYDKAKEIKKEFSERLSHLESKIRHWDNNIP